MSFLPVRLPRLSIPLLLAFFCLMTIGLTTVRPSAAQNVRTVKLRANDIVYDAKTKRIFASVPSSAGRIGNSIIRLDPATGGIGPAVFIGSEPGQLALSSGSQFLYVALNGAAAVRRYDMATQTAGLQFALGNDNFVGPYYAGDIAAVPGSPGSIAVNRVSSTGSGQAGVAIYDNGIARPGRSSGSLPYMDALAFASPTRLYSFENSISSLTFARLNVDASGAYVQDEASNVLTGYNDQIIVDGGLVFATNGQVLNPESLELLGKCSPVKLNPFFYTASVVPDAALNRVYFLTQANATSATVLAFDRTTFLPVGALTVPGLSGLGASLVRWGSHGLAFRTAKDPATGTLDGGQLVFIDSLDLPGLRSLTINSGVVGGAAAVGTVTLSQPAPPVGVRVSLFLNNPQAATVPATVLVPAGKLSATFPITTRSAAASANLIITAVWGAQIRQSRLTVLNSARTPVYGPQIRVLPLLTGDLAYDKTSGKLYASVPSAAGDTGNSLTTINPATGAVGTPVFVGSEPSRLALSGDGQFVYAALDGAAAVRRFDTASGVRGPRFSLGRHSFFGARYVKDMAVLPGNPRSIAVSRRYLNVSPDYAGIAIFDDGVPRPQTTSDRASGEFLAFGASPARLYGSGYPLDLFRMTVSASGVVNADQNGGILRGPIKFDSGLLYGSDGKVVNPETLTLQGTFADIPSESLVVPDGARGKVYVLVRESNLPSGAATLALRTYDTRTFRLLDSFPIPDVYGTAASLTLCGPNRFAFRIVRNGWDPLPPMGDVYLIDLSGPAALGSFTFSPATVRVGSTTVATVTLTGLAPAGGATVALKSGSTVLGNIVLDAGQSSGTLTLTAHVPGSYTVSATLNGVTKTTPLTITP